MFNLHIKIKICDKIDDAVGGDKVGALSAWIFILAQSYLDFPEFNSIYVFYGHTYSFDKSKTTLLQGRPGEMNKQ